jgi:hypothetical protein
MDLTAVEQLVAWRRARDQRSADGGGNNSHVTQRTSRGDLRCGICRPSANSDVTSGLSRARTRTHVDAVATLPRLHGTQTQTLLRSSVTERDRVPPVDRAQTRSRPRARTPRAFVRQLVDPEYETEGHFTLTRIDQRREACVYTTTRPQRTAAPAPLLALFFERFEVAPGSHGSGKRGDSRQRGKGSSRHGYAQTRMNRPPPHVHGKEAAPGSSPGESLKPPLSRGFCCLS